MEETNNTATSTKGKGLGVAGMVIGIVAVIWAIIPLLGAGAWWLAVVGLVLSIVGFVMAKNGNNPNRGMNDGWYYFRRSSYCIIFLPRLSSCGLKKAKRPLILIGSGAMMFPQKSAAFANAVQQLGVPVYLSGMGRGLLGNNHPLQLRHHRKEALKAADLIILAGVSCDFRLEYGDHLNKKATYININRSADDLNKNKKPHIGILADPEEYLIALSQVFTNQTHLYEQWMSELHKRDSKREENIAERALENPKAGINALQLYRALDKNLEDNAILIADGGDFVGAAAYTLRPRKPLSWLDPGAFGTLDVGAGFALGAKLCFPDAEVYIIWGDGSCAYSILEYDTSPNSFTGESVTSTILYRCLRWGSRSVSSVSVPPLPKLSMM